MPNAPGIFPKECGFQAFPASLLSCHVLVAPSKPSANSCKKAKSQPNRPALGTLTLAWKAHRAASACLEMQIRSVQTHLLPLQLKPYKSFPLAKKNAVIKELFNFECSWALLLGSRGSYAFMKVKMISPNFKAWALFPP